MGLHPWFGEWGQEITVSDLTAPTALAFVESVNRFASHMVEWKGARRRDDGLEFVYFDLTTDAPQQPHAPIHRVEPIGIIFGPEGRMPGVLALRDDFPDTEHQQLVPEGVPCALCVDDRPWVEARVSLDAG